MNNYKHDASDTKIAFCFIQMHSLYKDYVNLLMGHTCIVINDHCTLVYIAST